MPTNPGEIPDNGTDDDNNGYIDDVRDWDFVNNPTDDNGHGAHRGADDAHVPGNVLVEAFLFNSPIAADPESVSIGDFNENGIPDLMFRFGRSLVEGLLQEGDSVAITVTGGIEDQA